MSNDHGPKNPGLLANTVALIGLIILAAIVIWGLLHLGSLSSTWLSSLFPGSSTSISVTAPKSTTANDPFALTWKFKAPSAGTYALVYQCVTGATLSTIAPNGSLNTLPCGTAYTLGSATSSVVLVPQLRATTTVSIPVSIVFMPQTAEGAQARGSAIIGVSAATLPTPVAATTPIVTTTSSETPKPSTTVTVNTSSVQAPADLSVRIVSVSTGNPARVTFDISNVGGTASGTYYFTAQLPTDSGYVYSSPAQASLNPGDHVSNTLTFSPIAAQGGMISIHVGESNGANNYAQQWISGAGYIGTAVPASYYDSYTPTYSYPSYPSYPSYDTNYYDNQNNYQGMPGYGPNPYYPAYPQYQYSDTNYPYGYDHSYPYLY